MRKGTAWSDVPLDVPPNAPNGRIEFFDFTTGETVPILNLKKPAPSHSGLAISPDGKSLLYGQNEFLDSYIMLVKNFR